MVASTWAEAPTLDSPLTVRAAGPADSLALLAEREGAPVAAIALASGAVLGDPLGAAPDAVRVLKLTRYRILRQGGQAGAERALLRRAATGRR